MASPLFLWFFLITLLSSSLLPLHVFSATVEEDLSNLKMPTDFVTTIIRNCNRNPLLGYCNNTLPSSMDDLLEIFKSTIVASHLCEDSKNPNCVDSFSSIRIHGRPKTAELYLSFDFFWKFCPLTVIEVQFANNSLTGKFPKNVLSCSQIRSLDLKYNQFSGFVPVQELLGLTNLTHLNISYNRFWESNISDLEFFKRFNASSFVESGVLPNKKLYKMEHLVLLFVFLPVVIFLCFCLGWVCLKRPDYLPRIFRRSHNKFTSAMLEAATDEFSDQNLVSKSHGVETYRGMLRGGTKVKIKVYTKKVSKEKRREFDEQCETYFRIRHKNVVTVLGWCNSRNLRALVTEWICGENVETWLSSSSWRRRLKIVKGVVDGLRYLSDEWPQITFDLNTCSLLVPDNNDQEPLISKFMIGHHRNNTSRNIFKFGVFVLEMITNLKPDTEREDAERSYVEYIRAHYPNNLERVIDVKMRMEERTMERVKKVVSLGLMCTDAPTFKQPSLSHIYDMVDSLYESFSRHHHH